MIHVPTSPLAHPIFDLLAWAGGALAGAAIFRWRMRDAGLNLARRTDPGYFLSLASGAILGAWLAGSLNTLRQFAPTLSHSIAGALAGAIVGVEVYKGVRGIRGSTGGVFVGSVAVGIIIGRFGCLLSGLPDRTYGVATDLPWAVDLGDGIGRHPVQVYESLSMGVFLAVYLVGLAVRAQWAMRRGFYVLVTWYGAQRFVWEFLKPYPRLIGPFNVFHLICAGLIVYGVVWFVRDRRSELAQKGRALCFPGPDDHPL
jgi:prolipoprotein diacylglyceryltransferase